MMQSMKGATQLLGSMNRQMNLPALQRIAMEFEKENDIMDQRQEMMDDAIDDVTGLEDEEEGEEVVNQVLDDIGVDLGQAVSSSLGIEVCVFADYGCSWETRHRASRRTRSRRARLRKRLGVVETPVTTTSKRDSIAYDDDDGHAVTMHESVLLFLERIPARLPRMAAAHRVLLEGQCLPEHPLSFLEKGSMSRCSTIASSGARLGLRSQPANLRTA